MFQNALRGSHWRKACGVIVSLLLSANVLGFQIPSGTPPPPPPPPPPPDQRDDVVKLGTTMVLVSFSAIDKRGEYVLDLTDQEVEILENGRKQQISYFRPALINSQQESPTLLMLLVDQTKSVGSLHLTEAAAAGQFTRALPQSALVAVSSFGQSFTVRQTFTRDWRAIEEVIGAIPRSSDKTGNLFQAVATAVGILDRVPPLAANTPNRKVLVVISSGLDSGKSVTVETAVAAANASNVTIYAVEMENSYERTTLSAEDRGGNSRYKDSNRTRGMPADVGESEDSSPSYLSPRGLFEQLATDTGGLFFSAVKSSNGLGPLLRKVALQVRNEYLVGYEAKNLDSSGKLRKIDVKVVRKGVKVRGARKGYIPTSGTEDVQSNPRK